MSSALFLIFQQAHSVAAVSQPVAIDPLAVASVETGHIKQCGARLVMDSGTIFDLKDEYEGVVRSINDARTVFADERRRQIR